MAKKKETGIDNLSYPDTSTYNEKKIVNELSRDRNLTPADKKARAKGVLVAPPKRSVLSGIEGETIYKNTGINVGKDHSAANPKGKASAIYSGTYAGATLDIQGRAFDSDIKKSGIGTTPFSQTIQSPELQQKPGGIEMAGVNPVNNSAPFGENQYGAVGQDSLKYQQEYYSKAANLLNNLPYGTLGDRQKRNAMIASARQFSSFGAGYREQFNKDRKYGIDKYNALNPAEPSQIGRYKTVPAAEGYYGPDVLEGDKYVQGEYFPAVPAYQVDTATGQRKKQNPSITGENIGEALKEGRITRPEADKLLSLFPELGLK